MDKKSIAAILDEMGTILELKGENQFKSRAFHNASRAVEGITDDLAELVESGKLLDVKGIGKSIALVITDLVRKGVSDDYTSLRKSVPSGVLDMLRIQGLGPKKAKLLFEKLKITTIEALEKAANEDKLSSIEGFGKKSQENILAGIASLRKRQERTLYPIAFSAAQRVRTLIAGQNGVIRCEVAGSLRRRRETIGDIDILASAKKSAREKIMKAFVGQPGIQSIIGQGDTKSSVTLEEGINCDLRIVDDAEFPFALNYFTGSKEHNVEMRSRAKKIGLSLNEYGFSKIGATEKRGKAKKEVACRNEDDIYSALELPYIPPELRENMGEFEAAEADTLPLLVTDNDLRGTFHCHTTFSDGVNTLEQMTAGARKLGWEYLGIADHSKAAAYAGGLTEDRVKQQRKAIDQLNESMKGFRVFHGTECDILPTGELDWSDKVLASFEYVVISVHSNFAMSEKDMTRRVIKALKNKHVTMLGHATGRLLLEREAYPIDMRQVIDAAADYGKAIEINAHPMRLDLDWRLCRYARDRGVMIVINPDAHNVDGLRDVRYGVGVARKGWLRATDILNTRPAAGVLDYFQRP